VNTCAVCAADPTRDVVPTLSCSEFDGNQSACEGAFQYDNCGRSVSCFYDSGGSCLDCGPDNFATENCRNTCVVGPPTCERDPSRTIFAGGPGTQACQQFDGDPVSCLTAFHQGQNGGLASCFYDGGSCLGCGAMGGNSCLNTCLHGVAACTEDPGRTLFAGGPQTQACHAFDGNQSGCEDAYHLDQCFNPASCWYDPDTDSCNGCGPNNQQDGFCTNTCSSGPASCDLDPSRTIYAGGPMTSACQDIANQAACLATFHTGQCGVASCYWDGFGCAGCGPNNEFSAECFNTCEAP
jgi:hypothetical protein